MSAAGVSTSTDMPEVSTIDMNLESWLLQETTERLPRRVRED